MKVQVSLDDDLMKRVDQHVKENYMSRSGLMSIAVTQYLNNNDMVKAIKEIAFLLRKISENETITEEQKEQLADMELLIKMMSGSK